jgi:RNA recognition motif-containing protein
MKYLGNISKVSNFEQTVSDPTGIIELYSKVCFSSGGFDMSTHIHVSGLSYFCTDDKLREAFTPFGTVVLAQVLRDECGHSLGLGIVHMACSEDVERVFNEHQRFEVSGSRVDLWEPVEPEDSQGERIMSFTLRETPAAQTGQDMGHEKNQKVLKPVTVRRPGLSRSQQPSSRTAKQ